MQQLGRRTRQRRGVAGLHNGGSGWEAIKRIPARHLEIGRPSTGQTRDNSDIITTTKSHPESFLFFLHSHTQLLVDALERWHRLALILIECSGNDTTIFELNLGLGEILLKVLLP